MFFSLSLSVGPSGSEQGIQLRHSSSLSSVLLLLMLMMVLVLVLSQRSNVLSSV